MKRTEPIRLGDMLEEYLRRRPVGPASMEGRAVELWAEVAGEYTSRHTEDVYIRNGVLYVTFSSASVRAEIFMRRREIIESINGNLRQKVVRRMVIR